MKDFIYFILFQPVKPTAVRATSTMNSSTNSLLSYSCNSTSSTPNKPILVSSTPSKQQPPREPSPSVTSSQLSTSGNFAAIAANITIPKPITSMCVCKIIYFINIFLTNNNYYCKYDGCIVANGENVPSSVIPNNNNSQISTLNTTIASNISLHNNNNNNQNSSSIVHVSIFFL